MRNDMLALRYHDTRNIKLEKIPRPVPGKGEVLLKVRAAGISQTQINEFVEGPYIINKEPHSLTGKSTPLIPSQEYGGVVEEVGEGVSEAIIGTQVAVLPLVACGECEYCKEGRENLCEKAAYHGLMGLDGGFAEYSVVSVKNIIPVSKHSQLTFIEPMLVAIHAARRYEKHFSLRNRNTLILGAGAIGITFAAVWRDYFGAEITLNDILYPRMARAGKAGFRTVDKEEIRDKYDLVVDAAGMDTLIDKPAIVEGLDYLKKGGILLNVGTYFHPVSFIPSELLLAEQTICESLIYTFGDVECVGKALNALRVDLNVFIDEIPLDEIIEKGYYRAEVDKESFTRIVVRPDL